MNGLTNLKRRTKIEIDNSEPDNLKAICTLSSGLTRTIPLEGIAPEDLHQLAKLITPKDAPRFEVSIVEMRELEHNIQYFVIATDIETGEKLDYIMVQTKYGLRKREALLNAWFSAGFLARFFKIPNEEIKLLNFKELSDEEWIFRQRNLNRVKGTGRFNM